MRILTILVLLLLSACPTPPPPGCRVNEIALVPVTKTKDKLITCGAREYAQACGEGVTAQDTACMEQCALYNKRSVAGPTNPALSGDPCGPNPVTTRTDAFTEDKCVADTEDPDRKMVSCTVTATCTCDP